MNMLIIISTSDGESIFNAMRLANVGVKRRMTSASSCLVKAYSFSRLAAQSLMSWSRSTNLREIFTSEACV